MRAARKRYLGTDLQWTGGDPDDPRYGKTHLDVCFDLKWHLGPSAAESQPLSVTDVADTSTRPNIQVQAEHSTAPLWKPRKKKARSKLSAAEIRTSHIKPPRYQNAPWRPSVLQLITVTGLVIDFDDLDMVVHALDGPPDLLGADLVIDRSELDDTYAPHLGDLVSWSVRESRSAAGTIARHVRLQHIDRDQGLASRDTDWVDDLAERAERVQDFPDPD